MKIPGIIDPLVTSGLKRGVRTFVAAFLAVYGIPQILGALSGSQPVDTSALRAAAVAGLAAVIALVWRLYVDPLGVPTLSDANRTDPTN